MVNFKRTNIKIKIPAQTVYGIINMLNKKRLISGKRLKNGNMPGMTVYSITPKGEKLVKKNLVYLLTNPQEILTELLISMTLIGYLDKETSLKTLKEYQVKTEKDIATGKALKTSRDSDVSFIRQISVEHVLNILQVNHRTVDVLIKAIETESRWADSAIPWWRDEIHYDKKVKKKTPRTQHN